jgi:hypothetical protein
MVANAWVAEERAVAAVEKVPAEAVSRDPVSDAAASRTLAAAELQRPQSHGRNPRFGSAYSTGLLQTCALTCGLGVWIVGVWECETHVWETG